MSKKRFYLSDHQGKGRVYVEALVEAGYERVESASDPRIDLAFYDHDVGPGGMGFRPGLDYFQGRGVPVLMYPHAARPMLQWDGMYPVWPHTRVNFVIAEGHKQVMESFGYPLPVEVVGWTYCEIVPPERLKSSLRPVITPPELPVNESLLKEMENTLTPDPSPNGRGERPLLTSPKGEENPSLALPVNGEGNPHPDPLPVGEGKRIKVLFGPIHPNNNGWMHEMDKRKNAEVFRMLLETPGIELTVRHIKRIDLSGLWKVGGVNYIMANPDGSTKEIDEADVVVGHQTFAYLAAARGKPLVMFGDDLQPHSGNKPHNFRFVKHWEAYKELMRYPINMEDALADAYLPVMKIGRRVRELMDWAMHEDAGAAWRELFIGKPFDRELFVRKVGEYT